MRVAADLAENKIIQVEKNAQEGTPIDMSGKYSVPIPEGVTIRVTSTSIILPSTDPFSVVRQGYEGLLAKYPSFENILFNPLLISTDIADLDPSGILMEGAPVINTFAARYQAGRSTPPAGNAQGSVALLAAADTSKPGVVVTTTIDTGPYTANLGADNFAVYWYIYDFDRTEDIRSSFGATAGMNAPCSRRLVEIPQEGSGFEAWLSINDGLNFFQVERLRPIGFCEPGRYIKLAFKTTGAKKYLAGYALMF